MGAFEDLNVNVGLLDSNDVDELSREFVKAFERTYGKLPDFIPLANLVNGISSSKSAQAYAERLAGRLENSMQFPSVNMPVRTGESVAVVVREKTRFANSGEGPIIASFELTMLPRDGRKLDDEDLTSRPSSPEDSKPYLTNLFVKEEYRRRGLGSALMKLAEEMAVKSWRQDSLYLHIDGYPPSEALYKSIGFEGVTPTDSDGATHMSKSLEAELREFEEFLIKEAEERARLEAERRAEEERRFAQKALGTSEAEAPQLEAPQT